MPAHDFNPSQYSIDSYFQDARDTSDTDAFAYEQLNRLICNTSTGLVQIYCLLIPFAEPAIIALCPVFLPTGAPALSGAIFTIHKNCYFDTRVMKKPCSRGFKRRK